jgi:lipooligosaccharide transport system ATP-binding protein
MAPIVEAHALTKRYGSVVAVREIDFRVESGEMLGLLGPNGAGKSTTMRMIYQVTPRDSGRLDVFGMESGTHARRIKERLGVVPQLDNLDEELDVEDNLLMYARFNRISGARARERTNALLEFTELTGKRHADVRTLSGGMKRRLTLARGLLNQPELLILDEPTTGLDPQVRITLWDKLDALRSEGTTVLMSTHYMDEAERLCDRVILMDEGRILTEGRPRSLISEHLPAQVIEARVGPNGYAPYERLADRLEQQLVRSAERVSVYVDDGIEALAQLARDGADVDRAFVRPTNLEDVFLELTGRQLRE